MQSKQTLNDNSFHLKYNPAVGGMSLPAIDLLCTLPVRVCFIMEQLALNFQAEIWKAMPGYEGYYEVSDLGRVKSLERIIRKINNVNPTSVSFSLAKAFHSRLSFFE